MILLCRGCPRKLAADDLGISINTLRVHARVAFHKLGAANVAQAVRNFSIN